MTAKIGLVTVAMLATLSIGSLAAQQPAAPAKTDSAKPAQQMAPAKAAPAKAAPVAKTAKAMPAAKWTTDQIKEAQEGLARAKLFNATPNGHLGPQTRRAIRAFQRANKLPVTGTLSDTLLVLLKNQQ